MEIWRGRDVGTGCSLYHRYIPFQGLSTNVDKDLLAVWLLLLHRASHYCSIPAIISIVNCWRGGPATWTQAILCTVVIIHQWSAQFKTQRNTWLARSTHIYSAYLDFLSGMRPGLFFTHTTIEPAADNQITVTGMQEGKGTCNATQSA